MDQTGHLHNIIEENIRKRQINWHPLQTFTPQNKKITKKVIKNHIKITKSQKKVWIFQINWVMGNTIV